MSLFETFKKMLGGTRIERKAADWDPVVAAISASAAYLAQGSSYAYLRARTLLAGPRLFQDEGFSYALQICKWEGYAVASQDIILMIEGEIRAQLTRDIASKKMILMQMYKAVLECEPVPEHRDEQGWDDVVVRFDQRLEAFMANKPARPDDIAAATALCLLEHAPIDELVRKADQVMVINNVGFRLIELQTKLRQQFDFNELAQMLAKRMDAVAPANQH